MSRTDGWMSRLKPPGSYVSQVAEEQDPQIALNARLSSAAPATPALNLTRHELNTRDTQGSCEIDADNRLTAERTQASTTLKSTRWTQSECFYFSCTRGKIWPGTTHAKRGAAPAGPQLNEKILAWLFLNHMAQMFRRSLSLFPTTCG